MRTFKARGKTISTPIHAKIHSQADGVYRVSGFI